MELHDALRLTLLYFVLPLWVIAGAADALCHKIAEIEHSSGPVESVIHLVMGAEVGAAVLAALFLELTGTLLVFLIVLWLAHEITSYLDLHYASGRRAIPPWEQRVHDYLAVLPLIALMLVVFLSWGQFLAIFGAGTAAFDGSIRLKEQPLSPLYLGAIIGAIALFNLLPYLLELRRTLRAAHRPAEG